MDATPGLVKTMYEDRLKKNFTEKLDRNKAVDRSLLAATAAHWPDRGTRSPGNVSCEGRQCQLPVAWYQPCPPDRLYRLKLAAVWEYRL